MLDCVVAERLRNPSKWEWERYRSALKAERRDWTDVLDQSSIYRWDESVLRKIEEDARREEYQRRLWFAPAPASPGGPRPNVFRALYRKDIGGVSGVSDSWFDAGLTTVDGGSGKINALVDYVDTSHALTQGGSTQQCALPAADASMGGALTLTFAGGQYYDSNRAPSWWTFLHDGTGSTIRLVFTPTNVSATTIALATILGTNSGMQFVLGNTGTVQVAIYNASAAIAAPVTAASALSNGTATYTSISYSESASPEYDLRMKSTSSATGSTTDAPLSTAPAFTFCLGTRGNRAVPLQARVRALYIHRRVLSSVEHLIEQQFTTSTTGIPA